MELNVILRKLPSHHGEISVMRTSVGEFASEFSSEFLKWCISQQLHYQKAFIFDHSYSGGLACTP